jgi:STE24 endopeptidase
MWKYAPWIILAMFVALMALTFVPAPLATIDRARAYFTSVEIERGIRFGHERRLIFWGETFAQLAVLLGLVFVGGGRRIVTACHGLTRRAWLPTLLGSALIYGIILTLVTFPFDAVRRQHLAVWGMTSQSLASWLVDHGMALGVMAVVQGIALVGLYLLIRWLPRWWWVPAALGAQGLAVVFAWLLPVVIGPLFNTFTPLRQTEWADWEPALRRIAERVNVEVEDVYVVDASRQSHHSNAYFAGFGATQRIVLFDNLLKKHTLPEIESVLGHELGHWLHDHIVKGIALAGLGLLAGFFVLSRLLLWAQRPLGLERPADPAGLPLVLLAMFVGGWLAWPPESAVSRHFERQADRAGLELAGQPEAFIAAEIKLVRDNLGNPAPAPWNVWLFASHPPALERIEMAQRWQGERER